MPRLRYVAYRAGMARRAVEEEKKHCESLPIMATMPYRRMHPLDGCVELLGVLDAHCIKVSPENATPGTSAAVVRPSNTLAIASKMLTWRTRGEREEKQLQVKKGMLGHFGICKKGGNGGIHRLGGSSSVHLEVGNCFWKLISHARTCSTV